MAASPVASLLIESFYLISKLTFLNQKWIINRDLTALVGASARSADMPAVRLFQNVFFAKVGRF